jgi:hypothetical protein
MAEHTACASEDVLREFLLHDLAKLNVLAPT